MHGATLTDPDVPISGIRLSGWLHREARHVAARGKRPSIKALAMPLSKEVDNFVKAASASLPRVSEIIAAFSVEDRAGAFELAERRYEQAARDVPLQHL